MSKTVFISYRREEAGYPAEVIYAALTRTLGRQQVLMDVDAIAPGEDFIAMLENWVAQSDLLLALIGPEWLYAEDGQGRRRLENPQDPVRVELRAAFARRVPVVPVLLDGAEAPEARDLPRDLRPLARRRPETARFITLEQDVARLLHTLDLTHDPDPYPNMGPEDAYDLTELAGAPTEAHDDHRHWRAARAAAAQADAGAPRAHADELGLTEAAAEAAMAYPSFPEPDFTDFPDPDGEDAATRRGDRRDVRREAGYDADDAHAHFYRSRQEADYSGRSRSTALVPVSGYDGFSSGDEAPARPGRSMVTWFAAGVALASAAVLIYANPFAGGGDGADGGASEPTVAAMSEEIPIEGVSDPASAPVNAAALWRASEADLREAQSVLVALGYYEGVVDGRWGPNSRLALAAFQRETGVSPADGSLTLGTLERLRRSGLETGLRETAAEIEDAADAGAGETAPPPMAAAAGSPFRDCDLCPAMVPLPAGAFMIGSPPTEPGRFDNEGPQTQVSLPAFAMARTEVTFEAWDACVADGYCRVIPSGGPEDLGSDRGFGRGKRPVIGVSWNDITGSGAPERGFIAWLNAKAGGEVYRLPSEAEWEYAARAGSDAPTPWEPGAARLHANFDGVGGVDEWGRQTAPVGSFSPNAFGLFDMHGNVQEWTLDCGHARLEGVPADGAPRMGENGGDCSRALVRGGSYLSDERRLRSANRTRYRRQLTRPYIGFRVVRRLEL